MEFPITDIKSVIQDTNKRIANINDCIQSMAGATECGDFTEKDLHHIYLNMPAYIGNEEGKRDFSCQTVGYSFEAEQLNLGRSSYKVLKELENLVIDLHWSRCEQEKSITHLKDEVAELLKEVKYQSCARPLSEGDGSASPGVKHCECCQISADVLKECESIKNEISEIKKRMLLWEQAAFVKEGETSSESSSSESEDSDNESVSESEDSSQVLSTASRTSEEASQKTSLLEESESYSEKAKTV